MPWRVVDNPSKELLDSLLAERQPKSDNSCHDCGVMPGEKHREGCDVARCLLCGGQRLSCDCTSDEADGDVWDGFWPGTKECYEKGYVAEWVPTKPNEKSYMTFDFNRLALERQQKHNKARFIYDKI
jgi:hypothetical protein